MDKLNFQGGDKLDVRESEHPLYYYLKKNKIVWLNGNMSTTGHERMESAFVEREMTEKGAGRRSYSQK